ncbi:hypothetical protein THASP1DRAFT_27946 [Thamnocephalis sphaerospora]|uniref:WD40-repeat-containing domain protein n=1 Tax=Thamnocephalis sphaerospora TaxID=78915 RepID=A0A4P9XX59_9FUNG|nr:hypothetical protein THASP1DRAFT_27946 [Thamnocephalis sphaerospora]|eukprot:RKP10261.1 hypothetical protein THASP1DRAFT_27946 [Thamnocephalis sphaerospora]
MPGRAAPSSHPFSVDSIRKREREAAEVAMEQQQRATEWKKSNSLLRVLHSRELGLKPLRARDVAISAARSLQPQCLDGIDRSLSHITDMKIWHSNRNYCILGGRNGSIVAHEFTSNPAKTAAVCQQTLVQASSEITSVSLNNDGYLAATDLGGASGAGTLMLNRLHRKHNRLVKWPFTRPKSNRYGAQMCLLLWLP